MTDLTLYRNRHDRDEMHFGELEATLVELSAALGALAEGTTVEDAIAAIDARISRLEGADVRVGSMTADAYLFFRSLIADAIVKATASGSFDVDAFIEGWLTLDAYIESPATTGSFTADAFIEGWFTLDAYVAWRFSIDAYIGAAPVTGSFTADAFIEGWFTIDARVVGLTQPVDKLWAYENKGVDGPFTDHGDEVVFEGSALATIKRYERNN